MKMANQEHANLLEAILQDELYISIYLILIIQGS
jgi:hypothetical protein